MVGSPIKAVVPLAAGSTSSATPSELSQLVTIDLWPGDACRGALARSANQGAGTFRPGWGIISVQNNRGLSWDQ